MQEVMAATLGSRGHTARALIVNALSAVYWAQGMDSGFKVGGLSTVSSTTSYAVMKCRAASRSSTITILVAGVSASDSPVKSKVDMLFRITVIGLEGAVQGPRTQATACCRATQMVCASATEEVGTPRRLQEHAG